MNRELLASFIAYLILTVLAVWVLSLVFKDYLVVTLSILLFQGAQNVQAAYGRKFGK